MMLQLQAAILAVWLSTVCGVQVEVPSPQLVRKEDLKRHTHEGTSKMEHLGTMATAEEGTFDWCMGEVQQQLAGLELIRTLANTNAYAKNMLTMMQDIVQSLQVSSNQTALVLKEFLLLNVDDYVCSMTAGYTESVNQTAVLAVPTIFARACKDVVHPGGQAVFSAATLQSVTTLAAKAAKSLACSEAGRSPSKSYDEARLETQRLAELAATKTSFLESGEEALNGMSPFLFFVMAAEHRLDYLDAIAPGAKPALVQEFGPAGGASLAELGGEALEAKWQRVVENLRKSGNFVARGLINSKNVRPHPFRPGTGEGLTQRNDYVKRTCSASSASTVDAIFVTRDQFDQGCSSPLPIGWLPIMTPACYGHDICCECGQQRTACDSPFGNAMVAECARKLGGFWKTFSRLACQAQGRIMATATWLWGAITGGKAQYPPHCSSACVTDMMSYKSALSAVDPWFKA